MIRKQPASRKNSAGWLVSHLLRTYCEKIVRLLLKKNELVEVTISGISQDGNGVGRHKGQVVFVPMTAVGDRLRVKIVKVLKTHAFGIVAELLEPSPDRVENDCPVYRRCGGCSLRHIGYAGEMVSKSSWLADNMRRIGHIQADWDAAIPAGEACRYRNKAQYPVRRVNGEIRTGFYARHSHDLVPVWDCRLQPAFFADIARAFCAFMEDNGIEPYSDSDHSGLVRSLYIRHAKATGQVMVCVVINGGAIPQEEKLVACLRTACSAITSIVTNTNRQRGNTLLGDRERTIYGTDTITDRLCGVTVALSPRSFYQVNHDGAEALYRQAFAYAQPQPGDLILDLYCGAGTIGLSFLAAMQPQTARLIGVEVVEAAVGNARRNAAQNGMTHAEFLCADAAGAVQELQARGLTPDMVLLDPPRKGAAPEVLLAIAQMKTPKIVYISCNSATLARDCARLAELGYQVRRGVAADMFPRTAHVEAVVLLMLS